VFADDRVGLVQAPQEHRDGNGSLLKRFMAAEYRAFFDSGMVERAEDNAFIVHGTMVMVRRTALESVGGWNTASIVEDTELGLRLLEKGWHQHYTTVRYGAGITPDSFKDFRQQRHRWAYGSVQIMKMHARHLMPWSAGLTLNQKMHFWLGWVRWWSDALGLIVTAGAILWTLLASVMPMHLPPPEVTLIAISALAARAAASMLLTKFASSHPKKWGHKARHGWLDALGTAFVGMSLSYTVGSAVIKGMFTKHEPFKVTSKGKRRKAARYPALPEAALCALLLGCSVLAVRMNGSQTLSLDLWTVLLAMMAVPNATAALLAAGDLLPAGESQEAALPHGELSREGAGTAEQEAKPA
jgi:hypothetical protein